MAEDKQPEGPRQQSGDLAPALAGYSEEVLFEQVWEKADLSPRDRSLVTMADLITGGCGEPLAFRLGKGLRERAQRQRS
ncbi:carboxymuconolactone decarboxylase family protein [Streptomyces sp. NPDC014889]|uniref:carboxymuconolactone decarboxylase family protein n=1 Tax=Streptomyces sp. NPDC014889 TaxID=3364928 RepID=UPI0036F59D14